MHLLGKRFTTCTGLLSPKQVLEAESPNRLVQISARLLMQMTEGRDYITKQTTKEKVGGLKLWPL
jgi:hypothetical protein